MLQRGKVYLVGAGPGDPGLITVRGLNLLRQAEVLIYDRLVHPDLVAEAPDDAVRIYVGKESGRHCMSQDRINRLLVTSAQDGALVVRLKGGDPFVFGRPWLKRVFPLRLFLVSARRSPSPRMRAFR
jgi:siroheme synthase